MTKKSRGSLDHLEVTAVFPRIISVIGIGVVNVHMYTGNALAGWVRMQRTDVIRTRLISVLMGAKMQRLEVVRGHSEFLSHFSIPQANPTQPVTRDCLLQNSVLD